MEIAANRQGGDQGGQGDQHKQDRQRPQPEGNDGWRQTVAEEMDCPGMSRYPSLPGGRLTQLMSASSKYL